MLSKSLHVLRNFILWHLVYAAAVILALEMLLVFITTQECLRSILVLRENTGTQKWITIAKN